MVKTFSVLASLAAAVATAIWLAVALAGWAVPPVPEELRWPSREGRLKRSYEGSLRATRWARAELGELEASGASPHLIAARKAWIAEMQAVAADLAARIRAETGKGPHELTAD